MGLQFCRFIIESQNPSRLYHFLSFIFDVEAEKRQGDQILFEFEDLCFFLKETESTVAAKVDFTLGVGHFDELKELSQNIEFYYYKEGHSNYQLDLKTNQLSFSDTDNRVWKIELMSKLATDKVGDKDLCCN